MKKKIGLWAYVLLFWIICMVPSTGMLFYRDELTENRILSRYPVLWAEDGTWNADYTGDLQTYAAEHFAFRSELIRADSLLKLRLLRTPCDDQVVIGREGWLFFDETLGDYVGIRLCDTEIERISVRLCEVCSYIREQGKEPLIVIVPNKNSIYPEYMPARFGKRAEVTNLTLLQERMREKEVPFVDAYQILLDAKTQDAQYLYFREDTHWNNTGARLVLNEIYAAFDLPDRYGLADYTVEKSHEPDLYNILFPTEDHFDNQHMYDDGKEYEYTGRVHSLDDMKIGTFSEEGNGRSILVYRDSFGRALIPYIGGTFRQAAFYRSMPYDLSLVENTECDFVLIEIVERNLEDLGNIEIPLNTIE